MTDRVYWQDDVDDLTEGALTEVAAQANLSNYVERGLELQPDFASDTVDVLNGYAVIEDANQAYAVFPDARTDLSLPDTNGVNYVYVRHDPTTDDAITVSVESSETSYADPQLLLGTVDTANQTSTELNRAPSIEAGPVTAGVDDSTPAAQSGAVRLPNGEWVAARDSADGADVDLFRLTSSDLLEHGAAVAGVDLGDGYGLNLAEDAGAETLVDMSVTSSPAAGTEESYSAAIDATDLLKFYAESDGAGGIQNASVRPLVDLYDPANSTTVYDVANSILAAATVDAGSGGVETDGDVQDTANAKTIYDSTQGQVTENVLPATEGGPARSDETEVSTTNTSYAAEKTWSAVINATELNAPESVVLHSETKGDGSGNTVYVALFIDGTKYIEATTTSGTYTLLKGGASISGLSEGIHTFELQMKVGSGTGYNRLTEVWFK